MAVTVVLYVCWGLFSVTWLTGAAINRRRGPAVLERTRRDWTIYVAAVAIGLVYLIPSRIWDEVTVGGPVLHAAGACVVVAATAFTLWARFSLGDMWSSDVVKKREHNLHTTGPYRLTRHPIYTGMFGMLLGSAMALGFGETAFVAAAIVVPLVFKARAEERLLVGMFPGDYERYRVRVPMLVPGPRSLHS